MVYFNEFVNLVQGPWIGAATGSDLWSVTLPQVSRNNGTLRHAAMAIGALSKWYSQSGCKTLSVATVPTVAASEVDAHYFRALAHYSECLKLKSEQVSVQDAVFLSILLLCFESLRGNGKAALDHVNHGLALLVSLLATADGDRCLHTLAPNPKPLISSVAEIFSVLAPQARVVLRGRIGDSKPLPNFTQRLQEANQTLESFIVLLGQLPRPSADLQRIPARFTSLDEFQNYWATTYWKQTSIGPVLMDIIRTSGITESMDEQDIDNFFVHFIRDDRMTEFYEGTRAVLRALDAAFLPLFNKIMLSDSRSPEYIKAIHLRLQYLGTYVLDNTPQYIHIETLQAQTPLFREYLSLAEVALQAARQEVDNPARQLSLQCNLASHLLLVSLFCRDPVARNQAVGMLRDYPGQDGLWRTRSLYVLALRNQRVEQQNAIEGEPNVQWRRFWRREYIFEEGGDHVIFRYLERDDVTGDWGLIEETADTNVVGRAEDVPWVRRPPTQSGRLLMAEIISPSS